MASLKVILGNRIGNKKNQKRERHIYQYFLVKFNVDYAGVKVKRKEKELMRKRKLFTNTL